MNRIRQCTQLLPLAFMLVLFFVHPALGTDSPPGVFDFESGSGTAPDNWRGGPAATLTVDSTVVHSGNLSGRIQRDADSEGAFSALSFRLPADRTGDFIELRGWLKSEDVDEWFGLWLRLDGNALLAFGLFSMILYYSAQFSPNCLLAAASLDRQSNATQGLLLPLLIFVIVSFLLETSEVDNYRNPKYLITPYFVRNLP